MYIGTLRYPVFEFERGKQGRSTGVEVVEPVENDFPFLLEI
jgi:hypothetical protein